MLFFFSARSFPAKYGLRAQADMKDMPGMAAKTKPSQKKCAVFPGGCVAAETIPP